MADRPDALIFDVFGTCVDWRTGITAALVAELGTQLAARGVDPATLADAWRARYQPQLSTVRDGLRPWVNLDVLHREALADVLAGWQADDAARDRLTLAWHRLPAWPDTVAGLTALHPDFVLASCSNAHIALSVHQARHAGLPWDAILGAEPARAYKPRPEVYLTAVRALGLTPERVMMVAAHNSDLAAAAAGGLRTAFVARPDEYGPGPGADLVAGPGVDVAATDLVDLARRLAAG